MQVDPLNTHGSGDVCGSTHTSQPPETVAQTQNTNPDDLMDVGGQTLTGAATENHLGTEIADEQVLELNVLQDDMDQLCEGIVGNPFKTSTMGDLRDRTDPLHPTPTEVDPVVIYYVDFC